MQATIEKHAFWKFIVPVAVLPAILFFVPHVLFPQTAAAHTFKFLILTNLLSLVLLIYIYKITSKPQQILTLQIDNGEFALKAGNKVIISEPESNINLELAKHKPYQTYGPSKLLLKFMNQHSKLLLRIYVTSPVRFFPSFMNNTRSEFHVEDNWGKYETNKTEALKILKHFGYINRVSFE